MPKAKKTTEKKIKEKVAQTKKLRSPIVAVMGHVDHGKTTLLDTIRGARVADSEVGGITQNTRAHKVNVSLRERLEKAGTDLEEMQNESLYQEKDHYITFIDTPGHEAFSEMRSRGARVADIVVLVVAADDGVQPQTKESIKFIKSQKLPLIVACNKIDAPGANIDKIKQELASNDVLIEEYGGEAIFVPVSALKNEGISDLLENILLLAEVHELHETKPLQGDAEGFVLESNLDSDLGAVSLVILKTGSVKRGQYILADDQVHKIRATLDESQKQIEKADQGAPVWIIGLKSVLSVGETLIFFAKEEDSAKLLKTIEESTSDDQESIDEVIDDTDMLEMLIGEKEHREDSERRLKVILKADTQGTLEAIVNKLEGISVEGATIAIVKAETGDISESDIIYGRDVKGIVLGFQVKYPTQLGVIAKREKVLVRTYSLIYELLNEVEAVVHSMLSPEEEIEEIARARVKQVFTLSDGTVVAGAEVTDGKVIRGYKVFIERKGEDVGDGKIVSLKHLKQDVKEANKGTECGIIIEPKIQIEEGDFVVCYKILDLI